MDQPELSCRELVELVTDYLEGALPPDERERFDAHLETCPGCRLHLAQVRATIELVRRSAQPEAHPGVAALREAFRDWRRGGAAA